MPYAYLEDQNLFEIRTDRSSYLFGINDKGTLQHVYWGNPVAAAECGDLLKSRLHSSFGDYASQMIRLRRLESVL